MHPLIEDLSELKDQELEAKILDLSKKYWIVRNPDVKYQITLLLDAYQMELKIRRSKALEQTYQNRDKDLDKLINVN